MPNQSIDLEGKRVFLIACSDEARRKKYAELLQRKLGNVLIYHTADGSDALFKMANDPPSVLIVEAGLPRVDGLALVRKVLGGKLDNGMSIIILGSAPENEVFVDEVVSGQVQFLAEADDEAALDVRLTKALNRLAHSKDTEYTLHFLAPGEFLFKEGEPAHHVFIVKRGRLRALKGHEGGKPVVLGEISIGEFVGEMAHINHEPRSASVQAIEDCELIEIPHGTLDTVLFSKPAWALALVTTLSKRLKITNEALAGKS